MPKVTRNGNRARNALLLLVLIIGGANLLATHAEIRHNNAVQRQQRAAQARQGRLIGIKLCATFGALAALKPPPGNPAANPSRAFEDQLHATLDQIGPDLGCR